jgi:hypothetical protein
MTLLRTAGVALAALLTPLAIPVPAFAADDRPLSATVGAIAVDGRDGRSHAELATLRFAGEREVVVDSETVGDLPAGTPVTVRIPGAVTAGQAVAVLERSPSSVGALTVRGAARATTAAASGTPVEHSVVVMLPEWAGSGRTGRGDAEWADLIRTSLAQWTGLSHGRITAGDVIIAHVTLPGPATCDWGALVDGAQTVYGRGPASEREHFVTVAPPGTCVDVGWSGLGSVGGSDVLLPGDLAWGPAPAYGGTPGVIAHEIGHNLGLSHANTRVRDDLGHPGDDRVQEYGDWYQVMGMANGPEPLNAVHARALGLFSDADAPAVTGAGTYTLHNVGAAAGARTLRLTSSTLGNVFLEYRPADDPVPAEGPYWRGLRVYHQDGGASVLLDATPATSPHTGGPLAPALQSGNVYRVPGTDLAVQLKNPGSTSTQVVTTRISADRTAPAAPSRLTLASAISATPTLTWTPAGTATADGVVGYRVTWTGADGRGWVASVPGATAATVTGPLLNLGDQSVTVSVVALDAAGNTSTPVTAVAGLDSTPPGAAGWPEAEENGNGTTTLWWYDDWNKDDPTVDRYEVLADGVLVKTFPFPLQEPGWQHVEIPTPTPAGSHVLGVRVVDRAGNVSDTATTTLTTTWTPPTPTTPTPAPTTPPPTTPAPVAPLLTGPTTATSRSVTVLWTQDQPGNVTGYELTVDGVTAATPAAGDRTATLTLDNGTRTVALTAVGAGGRATSAVTFTVDNTVPTPALTVPATVTGAVTATWTQAFPERVTGYEILVDDAPRDTLPASARAWTATLPLGEHRIEVRAVGAEAEAGVVGTVTVTGKPAVIKALRITSAALAGGRARVTVTMQAAQDAPARITRTVVRVNGRTLYTGSRSAVTVSTKVKRGTTVRVRVSVYNSAGQVTARTYIKRA